MDNSRYAKLHKDLVDAACSLLDHLKKDEHAILEGMPEGDRLSIELALLPPVAKEDSGAMRTPPLTQRIEPKKKPQGTS